MKEIRTERLLLRAHRGDDAEAIVRMNADPRVQEFVGEPAFSPREALDWIADVNGSYPVGGERGYWAAEEAGAYLGWFHLRPAKDTGELELGYRFLPEAWGRGLATEGARALIALARERVVARTMLANRRSRGVMERLGMEPVRIFAYHAGGAEEDIEYALPWPRAGAAYRTGTAAKTSE